MQYLLLIYGDETRWDRLTEDECNQHLAECMAFEEEIRTSGHSRAGDALQPTSRATSVRLRGGKVLCTDGPFAETKEQLGGFYVIEARDLDEAVAIAARVPAAAYGSIELRPIR
jgi:hypothetical protein